MLSSLSLLKKTFFSRKGPSKGSSTAPGAFPSEALPGLALPSLAPSPSSPALSFLPFGEGDPRIETFLERVLELVVLGIKQAKEQQGKRYWVEKGPLREGRGSYTYIKPAGSSGWLITKTPQGWTITMADKIYERDLFLRAYSPLEEACVVHLERNSSCARVTSSMFRATMGPHLYAQKLLDLLDQEDVKLGASRR